jgi:hypothetical protein
MTRWSDLPDHIDPSRVHDQTTPSTQTRAQRQLERHRRAGRDEGDVQQAVIRWAWSHPDERLGLLRAYPADGPRVFAAGLVQGTPDLLLPVPSGTWAMLWLELKHPTRSGADLTTAQYTEMRRLMDAGHAVEIAWTAEQARWVLTSYLDDPDTFLPGY